jgi:NADP-dependent 3-hydroxy acid dehydrogenase YdfG
MKSIKNKVVFITGASSGIGEACAKIFAAHGAKLLLCARRKDRIDKLANELQKSYGTQSHTFALDVRNGESVAKTILELPPEWQNIDILVNNAGLAAGAEQVHEADLSDWEAMIDTNIKGLLYITRAVIKNMLSINQGHIINIGSVAGHEVYPAGSVYCATKHAVYALTKGLKMDLLGTNIRVSTVDPGMVETEFSLIRYKGDKARAKQVYHGMQPLTADDIADAVLYCASRPAHVNILEIVMMPVAQAGATQVARAAT